MARPADSALPRPATLLAQHSSTNSIQSEVLCPFVQLPEQDELLWDDGSATPEYCLDQFPLVSKVSCDTLEPSPGVTRS